MTTPPSVQPVARLVEPGAVETLDVLGPTVQFVTSPDDGANAPLVIRGTIPPGGVVPLHSHADPETFLVVSGRVEGLAMAAADECGRSAPSGMRAGIVQSRCRDVAARGNSGLTGPCLA